MRNKKNCTAVGAQCILKNLSGHNIQMVSWFIENQKIGIREHQLGQRNTPAFTAAQVTDIFKYIVACKKKRRQYITNTGMGHRRPCIGNLIKNRLIHIQNLMFLIIITNMDITAQMDKTLISRNNLIDNLQDRCLAGAIISNQCHLF